jgi:hypothetical protein
MASFDRVISPSGLEALLSCTKPHGPHWFAHLLAKWRPAGQDSGADGLRLALRNGYLNFYRCGQSVARVCFGRGAHPQAEVHMKYIDPNATVQRYARLVGTVLDRRGHGDLTAYSGVEMLEEWISRAGSHGGREKTFVDRVITYNPNVIDLEMALPAASKGDTAPRMDLVVLEPRGENHCIAFWEAKVMGDGRLRKRDPDRSPEVIGQLDEYRKWIERNGHSECVAKAYKRNCEILVALHKLARSINPDIGNLGDAIIDVATSVRTPNIDTRPRLLIDDRNQSASWSAHEGKLRGLFQHYVRGDSAAFKLPVAA